MIHQTNAINEILVEREDNQRFLDVIEKTKSAIGTDIGAGRLGPARELLGRVMDQIEGMPEGYWKQQFKVEMGNSFKGLLDKPQAASLAELVEDND